MASKPKGAPVSPIRLPRLEVQKFDLWLVGDSPLLCHAWSAKAKQMMLDAQMKKAKSAKEPKDPYRDYLASLYPHPEGGYGFPAVAFKSAAVDACSHVDGITKVEARGAFHILCDLVKIEGEPESHEAMVRVGMGTADIRYRGIFPTWRCRINLRINVNVLSLEQVVNLFNVAGFAIGVGEWRPERNGSHGMFHVE